VLTRTAVVLLGVLASLVAPVPAAHAEARVSISSDRGGAVVDPTYATTLKVGGAGFQSVRGGHGGIYVFFGTVSGNWRPSKGGVTGQDYFYVPDSESQANAGHQKYVAFPGSDTAASANGGVVSAAGRWSTTITVPGASFRAVDRDGGTRTIDCRKVRCGIITVGAHGVTNAANETFTPVAVRDLYGGEASPSEGTPAGEGPAAPGAVVPDTPDSPDTPVAPQAAAAPVLDVDRPSAVAGRALSFTARGLTPGAQVSAVLDDGVAAAGPFLVGAQGQVTGVVTLPLGVSGGTHELRLFGLDGDQAPVVRFAIAADDEPDVAAAAPAQEERSADRWGIGFFVAASVVLAGALARLVLARRRRASRA
jgi:hypothetical protein